MTLIFIPPKLEDIVSGNHGRQYAKDYAGLVLVAENRVVGILEQPRQTGAFSFGVVQCLNFSFGDESIQEGEYGFLFFSAEFLHLLKPAD